MKKKSKSSPIWPYLGILGCLFLLSLAAPRAWERRAQRSIVPKSEPAIARTVKSDPPAPIELESTDTTELAPRAEELEFAAPFTGPAAPEVTPAILVPPAPYFAEDFRLDDDSPVDGISFDPVPAAAEAAPRELAPVELAKLPRPKQPADPPAAEQPAPNAAAPQFELPAELPPQTGSPLRLEAPAEPQSEPASELPAEEPVDEEPVVESPRESTIEPAIAAEPAWPLPRKLLSQLTALSHEDAHLVWVARANQLINEFCFATDAAQQRAILTELQRLATRDALLPGADASLESQATRARYGLTRWVDIWQAAVDLKLQPPRVPSADEAAARIRTALKAFGTLAAGNPAGPAWEAYLDLAKLESAAREGASLELRRQVARRTLERLNSPKLSPIQRKFVADGPLADLTDNLQAWLATEFDVDELLAHLEQLEYGGHSSDAAAVAANYQELLFLEGDSARELATHLDTHYRNANVRAAVSIELANRLVPQPGRIDAPVRDTVVNVPVRGQSSTFTKLSVLFVPDPQRIRIGLEAHGTVAANTISDAGVVRIQNRGQSTFLVRKLMVFGPKGLLVWPAVAEAENNFNYLVAMETDYDGVPIVGSVVRNIARSQHDEVSGQARRQTEFKVASRALQQLDSEVQTRLAEAERKMQRGQGATLERLGLNLVPISLATTEERVSARLRLGNEEQLGAFTPRPRAPSDSWFSLQVHESAINNMLQSLDLEGRRFELADLFTWIGDKLGQPDLAKQEDLPEKVRVTFADRDAVRINTVDGRLEVTFGIKELRQEGSRWHDFQVRAYYVPKLDGLTPLFERDPNPHYSLRLDGDSMRGKIEFKLRAIFSKVLSKNRDLRLLPQSITGDERLKDLQISQLTIEDGWIGVAYSPRRVSSRVAAKPEAAGATTRD
jgi:hypothetical protein